MVTEDKGMKDVARFITIFLMAALLAYLGIEKHFTRFHPDEICGIAAGVGLLAGLGVHFICRIVSGKDR